MDTSVPRGDVLRINDILTSIRFCQTPLWFAVGSINSLYFNRCEYSSKHVCSMRERSQCTLVCRATRASLLDHTVSVASTAEDWCLASGTVNLYVNEMEVLVVDIMTSDLPTSSLCRTYQPPSRMFPNSARRLGCSESLWH